MQRSFLLVEPDDEVQKLPRLPVHRRPTATGGVQPSLRPIARQGERQQPPRVTGILRRLLRDDGHPQPAGHQILDGLLIVEPRRDGQPALLHPHLLEVGVDTLLAAAALLPQEHRLAADVLHGDTLRRQLPEVFVHRRDEHHPVLVERRQLQRLLVDARANESHVEAAGQQSLGDTLAVALEHMELRGRMLPLERRQDLGQDVGRRDGGRADADNLLVLVAPAAQQVVPQVYDAAGAGVQLLPPGRHLDGLGGAHDEPRTELLLQLPDVGAHRGLGEVQLLRRLGKAAVLHHRAEGLQLLQFHASLLLSSPSAFSAASTCASVFCGPKENRTVPVG